MGVGPTACPARKTVTRGLRCPDCTLAQRRIEDKTRLERIKAASPLAATPDAGEDHVDEMDVEEAEEVGDALEEDDEMADEASAVPPAPPRRLASTPGHRQPAPAAARATGELSWWARTAPGAMTQAATERLDAMTADAKRRGITVSGAIND